MKTSLVWPSVLILAASFTVSIGAQTEPAPEAQQSLGTVRIRAILVGKELDLKPVAKREFFLCAENDCADPIRVVTSFDGEAVASVVPGEYWVQAAEGVVFGGSKYQWRAKVVVRSGDQSVLELSNDNATVTANSESPRIPVPTDEGRLYAKYKASVFRINAEGGHGSGFLVAASGLILTNAHVVKDSPFLSVKIDDTRKYAAQVLAIDETNDLAVLRIHQSAISGLEVLPLADDSIDVAPVGIGERVVAIGSPLSTETILTSGIISKVEMGAYFSDVSINPGSSGGPLFDMTGQVIGVTTFGAVTSRGPGVSGIVRIHVAEDVLGEAREKLTASGPPSQERLPVEPSFRFPAEVLAVESQNYLSRDRRLYHLEVGPIDVQFITAPMVSALQVKAREEQAAIQKKRNRKREKSKTYTGGVDFYEWQRYVGDYRAVVTVQAVPEIRLTGGSAFAVAMLGAAAQQKYRFKTDFDRMELHRDGVVVQPIHPGRVPQAVDTRSGNVQMKDMTFYGAYEYPPEAFRPDALVELKVWHSKSATPKTKTIKQDQLNRIWRDFEKYFEALQSEIQNETGSKSGS